jgi:threonine dehydratase
MKAFTPEQFATTDELAQAVIDVRQQFSMSELYDGPHGLAHAEINDTPSRLPCGLTYTLVNDTLQMTKAFKYRGAKVATRSALEHNTGIKRTYCASAGNHAGGMAAEAANYEELESIIDCAYYASDAKVSFARSFGATVRNVHPDLKMAMKHAFISADSDPDGVFVHPFDQKEVIAGQLTLGEEIVFWLQNNNMEDKNIEVLVPVGGGGLLAGVAIAIHNAKKQRQLSDGIRVVATEVQNKEATTWCDGTAVKTGRMGSLVLNNPEYVFDREVVPLHLVAGNVVRLEQQTDKLPEPVAAIPYTAMVRRARQHAGEDIHFMPLITGAMAAESVRDEALELSLGGCNGKVFA